MLHQSAREDKTGATFLASFISYTSYLFQHNRNPRAFLYTRLMLTVLLSIVENQSIMNYMAKEQNNEFVRICRQVMISSFSLKCVDHVYWLTAFRQCSVQHHYHLLKRIDHCFVPSWMSRWSSWSTTFARNWISSPTSKSTSFWETSTTHIWFPRLAFACIHRILVYLNNRNIQLRKYRSTCRERLRSRAWLTAIVS